MRANRLSPRYECCSSSPAVPRSRAVTRKPASPLAWWPRGCRRSDPRCPSATRSTDDLAGEAAPLSCFARPTPFAAGAALATHSSHIARPVPGSYSGACVRLNAEPALPLSPERQTPFAPRGVGRTAVGPHSLGSATFWAGRRCGDFADSSPVRTYAQSRAVVESPRVRGPCTAECEFSAATVLRQGALLKYWRCFPCAYGHRPLRNGRHRPSAERDAPDAVHHSELQRPSSLDVAPSTSDHTQSSPSPQSCHEHPRGTTTFSRSASPQD